MGQAESAPAAYTTGTVHCTKLAITPYDDTNSRTEKVSHALVQTFAHKCYTSLELRTYRETFRALAQTESGLTYWRESILCGFLEVNDAFDAGPVIFQLVSGLAAFPFPTESPAILTKEALFMAVTLLTRKYEGLLKDVHKIDWIVEVYRSLTVLDRGSSGSLSPGCLTGTAKKSENDTAGPALSDSRVEDEQDDDRLAAAALRIFDSAPSSSYHAELSIMSAHVPYQNLGRLVRLLLLIAPMSGRERVSTYLAQLSDAKRSRVEEVADAIMSTYMSADANGIRLASFKDITMVCFPYIFDALTSLFERFLFEHDVALSTRKSTDSASLSVPPTPLLPPPPDRELPLVLPQEGEILDAALLSQLSFSFGASNVFRRLRPLFSGAVAGFSMGSFERTVFNWQAPSILLVSGTILSPDTSTGRERAFLDALPSKRLPSSIPAGDSQSSRRVVYGAYISSPWKQTHKACFADDNSLLFQLYPTHDMFPASSVRKDYVYFNKSSAWPPGVGLGTAPAQLPSQRSSYSYVSSSHSQIVLGAVSLHIDDSLEIGAFTHRSDGGGAFHPSKLPHRHGRSWQDVFEVDSLEVWGCGGDEEAERQRKAWEWGEREAELRRKVNMGTGDREADREVLKMAGIIDDSRCGGSMG